MFTFARYFFVLGGFVLLLTVGCGKDDVMATGDAPAVETQNSGAEEGGGSKPPCKGKGKSCESKGDGESDDESDAS